MRKMFLLQKQDLINTNKFINSCYQARYISRWFSVDINTSYTKCITMDNGYSYIFDYQLYLLIMILVIIHEK
jgi:hypothetical protein